VQDEAENRAPPVRIARTSLIIGGCSSFWED